MASLTTQDLLGLLKGIQGEGEVKDITGDPKMIIQKYGDRQLKNILKTKNSE